MVYKGRVRADKLEQAIDLRMTKHLSFRKIASELNISSSTARRVVKKFLSPKPPTQKVKRKLGRPLGLTAQDKSKLEEALFMLRKKHIKYTVRKVIETSGLCSTKVSYRTFSRYIHEIVKTLPEQSTYCQCKSRVNHIQVKIEPHQ